MHRYRMVFVLLLSFAMPLQIAAEIVLDAPCPLALSDWQVDAGEDKEEHAMADMPCCPDEKPVKAPACKSLNTCQLCKTSGQAHLLTSLLLPSLMIQDSPVNTSGLVTTLFNPASIWRPPNIS